MVSKEVLNNPVKFNDAILDKPNKDYAQWILKMESWGGAIEIGIISDALAVAIYVVDIDAVKIEKFNEDKFDNYILILFNGIHYDSLTMNEFKTVFNKNQPESDDVLTWLTFSVRVSVPFRTGRNRECPFCEAVARVMRCFMTLPPS